MTKDRRSTLSAVLAAAIGATTAGAILLDGTGLITSAQAQTAEEKKQEQERHRPPPPGSRRSPPPGHAAAPVTTAAGARAEAAAAAEACPAVPAAAGWTAVPPPKPADASPPEFKKKEGIQRFQPPSGGQPGGPPPATFKAVPPPGGQPGRPPPATFKTVPPPEQGPGRPVTVTPGPQPGQAGPPGFAPRRFEDVKKFRVERVEKGGDRKVIQEPGGRFIVKEHNRTIVRHDESERFLRRPGARSESRPDGTVETFYFGRNGVRVVTVVDANGRLLRRFRRDRDGREHNIIDNRRFYRNVGIGLGIGALGIIALNLPPPRVTIPYDRYIVDYDRVSDDDLYDTLMAPPIEALDRPYSLEEIRDNYELRARVRSIDIDSIYFDSGAWEVTPDQYDKLRRIARAILRVLESNPEAVFLFAGYTDAVGPTRTTPASPTGVPPRSPTC